MTAQRQLHEELTALIQTFADGGIIDGETLDDDRVRLRAIMYLVDEIDRLCDDWNRERSDELLRRILAASLVDSLAEHEDELLTWMDQETAQ